jgi:hypothetical protein
VRVHVRLDCVRDAEVSEVQRGLGSWMRNRVLQAHAWYHRGLQSAGNLIMELHDGFCIRISHDINSREAGLWDIWRSLWRSRPPRSNLCRIRRQSSAKQPGYKKELAPISVLPRDLGLISVTCSGGGDQGTSVRDLPTRGENLIV